MRRLAPFIVVVLTAGLLVLPRLASADHENVIQETIQVADETFALELIADEFRTPVWGAAAPYNTKQLFVVDQFGKVTALGIDEPAVASYTFLDVGADGQDLISQLRVNRFDERGLLGLAFHPRYRKNGLLYTYTSEPLGPTPDFTTLQDGDPREAEASLSVIREWRVDDPRRLDAVVNPASSRVLLRIEQPQINHNGGAVVFGPDAMLYIALGDGGESDDEGLGHPPEGNGQSLDEGNVLGKILRIDPRGTSSANGQYGIPLDNPFIDAAGADEAFAYGFRNPFRISFDHGTGDLIAADVGQRDIEEVNRVTSGGNYGWPAKEGSFVFNGNGPGARGYSGENSPGQPEAMIDPIAQYDHDEGTSVTGGFVYQGSALSQFTGSYIFGDLTRNSDRIDGRFFQVKPSGELTEIVPMNNDGNRLLITGFGQDTEGELYVMGLQPDGDRRKGVVYKLVPTS